MRRKLLMIFSLILISVSVFSQENSLFEVSTIPVELLVKTNAVIRYDYTEIEVKAYNKFIYKNKRIVSVFNEAGKTHQGTVESYDNHKKIKFLSAKIYNKNGEEIKRFKEKDFEDVSAVPGGTLYSDNRLKYLDYTPVNYPYTVLYEVEVEYNSTAFFPGWQPIDGFYASTQHSEYKIINNSDTELKIKEINLQKYNIEKQSEYHYLATNLSSLKRESYSPSFKTFAPRLKIALVDFEMDGVKGLNTNWNVLGKWIDDRLLSGTETLPDAVKLEIRDLTKNATTDLEKAKIVYNYMQEKTRYISVQVGIGGWKPMFASDVERLGYSDCKGLSNYTKALLEEVGVSAYYALIYGGDDIVNIDSEFSSAEGNHAVICIPNNDSAIWLECTSQTNPFGFIANFTDDRDALLIKPEGGEIVHTTVYNTEDNLQYTKADVSLTSNGEISGDVTIQSQGYQYALHEGVQNQPLRDQELYFKDYWDYINNLSVDNISFDNDKNSIIFTEHVSVASANYATKSGKRLLVQPNMFNRIKTIPTRYTNRTHDFEIQRGYKDIDEFVITLDPDVKVEAMPKPVNIESKFGVYKFKIEKRSDNELIYKRTQILNKGYYPKEEYEDFRDFISTIVKHDKTKIVLTK